MAEGGNEKHTLALHITNFPPAAAEDEAFDMFIENKTGQEDFSVEFNKACDEAFVMFSKLTLSPSEIISRIQQAPLMGTSLTVEKTSSKHRVVVTNIRPGAEEQLLELYFESTRMNPLGDTVLVDFDSSCRAAIVTYTDPSAMNTVLSADHSKVLGSDALVQCCSSYFDNLSNYTLVDDEVDLETSSNVGSTAADDQVFDGSEDMAENGETGAVSGETGSQGRGRKRGRGGRGGRRRGNRGGNPGLGEGRQRTPSVSSVNSERTYDEWNREGGEGCRGDTRRGRGGRGVGDGGWSCDAERGRPPNGRGRGRGQRRGGRHCPSYTASVSSASDDHDHSNADRGNQRGYHPSLRRGHNLGSWRGGSNEKTGSMPNLHDPQNPIPPGSIRKEVEVKNEVKNEKCQLLTTMMREMKTQHKCTAFIDMHRHRVVLVGEEALVDAAVEDVYSRLRAMRSIRLELAPTFARKLDSRDGHHQVVEIFKNAQVRAIYYTDAEGHPMVIGADECAATSAADCLACRITTEEIGYDDRHASYLSSVDWANFVSSAERDWLLAIEITPRSSILVIGIAGDVEVAVDSIQSQLKAVSTQPPKSRPVSSSADSHRHRPSRVPQPHVPQEPSELCPICGASFPRSVIGAHADQCIENRRCPICDDTFSRSFSIEEFQSHVDRHFL